MDNYSSRMDEQDIEPSQGPIHENLLEPFSFEHPQT